MTPSSADDHPAPSAAFAGLDATEAAARLRRDGPNALPRAEHRSRSAIVLGVGFTGYAWRLWRHYSDALARKTFRFSIVHLSLLFAALLVDHYLSPLLF